MWLIDAMPKKAIDSTSGAGSGKNFVL